jgi:hypothetical protein
MCCDVHKRHSPSRAHICGGGESGLDPRGVHPPFVALTPGHAPQDSAIPLACASAQFPLEAQGGAVSRLERWSSLRCRICGVSPHSTGIVPSQLGSFSNRVFFDSGGIGRSVLGYYWGVRLGQVGVPSPPPECPQSAPRVPPEYPQSTPEYPHSATVTVAHWHLECAQARGCLRGMATAARSPGRGRPGRWQAMGQTRTVRPPPGSPPGAPPPHWQRAA